MQLSKSEREALVERVERRLSGRGVSRAAIHAAVDQVAMRLSLPDEAPTSQQVVALSAASMPDLASRFRQKLSAAGISTGATACATAGRHTVVTARVNASDRAAVETLAADLGASIIRVDDAAAGGAGN